MSSFFFWDFLKESLSKKGQWPMSTVLLKAGKAFQEETYFVTIKAC